MHPFNAVYARMLFAANVRTQTELANILGIKQASISDAKKRGNIPADWCMRLYDRCGINVDWQRFGAGPVYDSGKLKEMAGFCRGEWCEEVSPALGTLREPSTQPLSFGRRGEAPVFSTMQMPDGSFPEIGREVFPVEFLKEDAKVFRLLDSMMAPVLNRGALVAVERIPAVDGDVVAVFSGRELCFRRASCISGGWELKTEAAQEGNRYVSDSEWPIYYYGKAVWAFQPL